MGAGLGKNLRNAEPAADFDKFAARDNHVSAFGERIECEEGSRSAVIDHQSADWRIRMMGIEVTGFVFEKTQDQFFCVNVAAAPLAAFQVKLQVAVTLRRLDNVFKGRCA
jgi:hypothetical protein